jgi:hypothetical protein
MKNVVTTFNAGETKNRMELFFYSGCVVWNFFGKNGEDVKVITLTFDGWKVIGYEGVSEMPKEALGMLKLAGFDITAIDVEVKS